MRKYLIRVLTLHGTSLGSRALAVLKGKDMGQAPPAQFNRNWNSWELVNRGGLEPPTRCLPPETLNTQCFKRFPGFGKGKNRRF